MANVLVITNGATDEDNLITILALTGWGHTVTEATAAQINTTPTLLEGKDVLWLSNIENGSGTDQSETLAGHIVDLFNGVGHGAPETPGLVFAAPSITGFSSGTTALNSIAVEMGVLAGERRADAAQDATDVAQQLITLADDWQDFPVTNGFSPDLLDEETDAQVGADSTYGLMCTEAQTIPNYTTVPNETNPHAGKVILRMHRDKENQDANGNLEGRGEKIGIAVRTGDQLFGKRPAATAESNWVWFGFWGHNSSSAEPSGFAAQLAHSAVEFCSGLLTETYPTAGTQRSILFGIDVDALGLFVASSVAWTETLPAGTSITVETTTVEAGVVGAFASTINGGAINGFSASEDLTNKQALVRVTLATTDSAETPEFTDLKIKIRGDAATITATPTDFFTGGHLTWTTGLNAGLAQEVKGYDPSTQRLTFTVPARKTIAACDEFEILVGCLKRLQEDCIDKFGHTGGTTAPFFRGFPHVPGKDRLLDYPDAN